MSAYPYRGEGNRGVAVVGNQRVAYKGQQGGFYGSERGAVIAGQHGAVVKPAGGGAFGCGGCQSAGCGCGEDACVLTYVGPGGCYRQDTSYSYAGQGCGEFDLVEVRGKINWIGWC